MWARASLWIIIGAIYSQYTPKSVSQRDREHQSLPLV
jgi:hypothetical protein